MTRGAPVSTIQAIGLGMMLAWTPTVALVALLFWRKRIGLEHRSNWRNAPSDGAGPWISSDSATDDERAARSGRVLSSKTPN
jgi:hypothetical protein